MSRTDKMIAAATFTVGAVGIWWLALRTGDLIAVAIGAFLATVGAAGMYMFTRRH